MNLPEYIVITKEDILNLRPDDAKQLLGIIHEIQANRSWQGKNPYGDYEVKDRSNQTNRSWQRNNSYRYMTNKSGDDQERS